MNKKILSFGAHPDDVEFGCAGTLLILKEKGYDITIIDLTKGEAAKFGASERIKESKKASKILGIPRITLDFGDKKVSLSEEHKAQIKKIIEEFDPLFAFAPYFIDEHPDHVNTAKLVSEFVSTVHYYISNIENPNFGVDISETYPKKLNAINSYQTAIKPGDKKWFEKRNEESGQKLGTKYGELFFVGKNLILPGIFKKI